MLGQLARQDEAHSGLDLAGSHSGLLVVAGQLRRLSGNLLEDVSDEGVQDGDGTGGDTSVRVHLSHNKEQLSVRCLSSSCKIWHTRYHWKNFRPCSEGLAAERTENTRPCVSHMLLQQ